MECTQKKQLVAYPRVRIEKIRIRQFYSNKKYRNEGATRMFSLVFRPRSAERVVPNKTVKQSSSAG